MRTLIYASLALVAFASAPTNTQAAAITPGDLVIYRVGDGSAALGTTATAVFLDEYTTGGTLVQSFAMPTTGGSALTATGNSTTEGTLSLSQNGLSFVYTGYRYDVGGATPSTQTYTAANRVIGTLSLAGVTDTSTSITSDGGVTTGNAIRSATTVDGTAYWVSDSSRVSYFGSGTGSSGGTVQIDARNSRQIRVNGNTVYAANGSTAITGKLQSYGTLPTGATVPTPIISLGTADAIQGFAMFNLNNANPGGSDTIYAMSTVAGQLLKYSFNGSSWVSDGSLTSNAQDITGVASGSSVTLYLTGTSGLQTITDSSGFGGALSGSISTIISNPSNEALRGIEILVPEPSTAVLGGLGLLGLLFARRNRK